MILEAIVTTLGDDGVLNIAPMGPEVDAKSMDRFVLKPYKTSTTYKNLASAREGVIHVTDDVLLLARSAIGAVSDAPTRASSVVNGRILVSAARYYEVRVTSIDDSADRTRITVEAVASGRQSDLFGLNRAKHAVLEAAILATRVAFLPREEILSKFGEWSTLVDKTGGVDERTAFDLLEKFVREAAPIERRPE